MKNRPYRALLILILLIGFTSSFFAQVASASSKGISFQGVIKSPSGQFPTISGTEVLVKILSPNNCILREESFSGVNISNGYLNLIIGHGTPTANNPSPARNLNTIMNNSVGLSNLTCINADGSVNAVTTTYNPQSSDVRKLRISLQIDNDTVVADFNMRAVAFAVNAESLNGKSESNFINVNSVGGLTQANAESIFQRFTQLDSILNGNFTGSFNGNVTGNVSGTASNVTGVVAVANGGTGANSVSGARVNLGIKGLALIDLPTPIDSSKYLRGDGTWASVVGGVATVAGRSGDVVITTADLADFNTAADARATGVVNGLKGQVNGLASLDAGGKVPSTQLSLTSSDIPNIDASKINSGTLIVNVNSTSVNAGSGQFTQLKVNDGAGRIVTMGRQAGGADYTIQWPANVGAAGSVLQTDATGILSWVAIPSAPVSSVAGKTGVVTLAKEDISGLGTAAALNAGTAANNLVQLDSGAKIPASLLPNTVLTNSTVAGGDLSGTYPNPSIANNVITSSKIADGAAGSLSKVVSNPGSAGPNRLLASDTGTGTTIKDFYCTTIGHYLKWTGTTGFGCAAISSADIADATNANTANTLVKRDPSGNFSAGTVTANLTGNVTGNLSGNVTGKLTGAVQTAIANKTTNYNIQDSDGIITANASSGGLNFTLPSAVGMAGRQFTIKKVDSSSNAVTLSTTSSQTIDGSATAQLTGQWAYLTVTSDGANWIVTNSTGSNVTASVQFTFDNVTGAATSSVITSSTVTTTGSGTLTVSVSGSGNPQISINGGSWVTSGPITAGQTLAVRMTSSSSPGVLQTVTITAGSYAVNWSVTTTSLLYSFSSHTFTTGNSQGPHGPSLSTLQSVYSSSSWAQNTSFFNVSGGIQLWTVPATGTYRFTLAGASSVRQYYSGNGLGAYYGRGASFTTDLNLVQGEVIKILVGQLPAWNGPATTTDAIPSQQASPYECFNGGGGGTFIVRSSDNSLLAAAGGGGSQRTNYTVVQSNMDARTDFAASGNQGGSGSGGSGGAGGTRGTTSDNGSSGAGFSGNGNANEGASTTYYTFAKSFINGGTGAIAVGVGNSNPQPSGGFGGGGAGGWGGSGGGGGYSGGGGGTNDSSAGYGGGGANYSAGSGTSPVTLRTGQGYVTVNKL